MHDGRRPRRRGRRVGRQHPADRHPVDRQPVLVAEIRERQHTHCVAGRHPPGRGADTALEAQAAHPGPGSDRALGRRLGLASRPGRPRGLPGGAHVGRTDLHPARVGQEAVVTLGHHRDDYVLDADAGLFVSQQLAGRVVDAADLHGRGQEDGRLDQAPLGQRQEPGALARAVQHGAAGRHRSGEQVPAGIEDGHAGPGHAPARRRRRFVPPHRDVADAEAGHVGDRGGRTGRQDTYPDAKIAGPGGLFIG